MNLGDIKKINEEYGEPESIGLEVCIFVIDSNETFEVKATVISGDARGEKWLFHRSELS